MILEKTIQQRKDRLCVDTLLSFDAAKSQYVNKATPNIILSNNQLTICFIAYFTDVVTKQSIFQLIGGINKIYLNIYNNRIQLSFNQFNNNPTIDFNTIRANVLYFFALTIDSTTDKVILHVNETKRPAPALSLNPINVTWDEIIIGTNDLKSGDFLRGGVSYFASFNRILTEQEISYIHRYGGIIPKSTHAACIAHYVADKQGKTMWDCVEQYNYSKGASPLTAQHGTLQNYTDAEVGLPEVATQTAYKYFYDKITYQWWQDANNDGIADTDAGGFVIEKRSGLPKLENALQFNGSSQYLKVSNFVPTIEKGYALFFTFARADNLNFPSKEGFISKREGSNYLIIHPAANTKLIEFWTGAGQNFRINENEEISDLRNLNFLCYNIFPPDGNGNNRIEVYINGRYIWRFENIKVTAYNLINAPLHIGLDNGNYFSNTMIFAGIAKGIATPRQVKELSNNTLLNQPFKSWSNLDWQLLPNFNRIIDNTANVAGQYLVEDLSGKGHTIEAIGYDATSSDPASANYAFTKINDLR